MTLPARPESFEIRGQSSTTRYIALCGASGSIARKIVRFDVAATGGVSCETLLDGATLGAQTRISRLAALP